MELNSKEAEIDRLSAQMHDRHEDHQRELAAHRNEALAGHETVAAESQRRVDDLMEQLRGAAIEQTRVQTLLDEERQVGTSMKAKLDHTAQLLEEVGKARDDAHELAQQNETRWRATNEELQQTRDENAAESERLHEQMRAQEERLGRELSDSQAKLNEQHTEMLERL
eukprot:COSAG01_NODE_28465_length_660_cov_1.368984_1_plen_167_part_10